MYGNGAVWGRQGWCTRPISRGAIAPFVHPDRLTTDGFTVGAQLSTAPVLADGEAPDVHHVVDARGERVRVVVCAAQADEPALARVFAALERAGMQPVFLRELGPSLEACLKTDEGPSIYAVMRSEQLPSNRAMDIVSGFVGGRRATHRLLVLDFDPKRVHVVLSPIRRTARTLMRTLERSTDEQQAVQPKTQELMALLQEPANEADYTGYAQRGGTPLQRDVVAVPDLERARMEAARAHAPRDADEVAMRDDSGAAASMAHLTGRGHRQRVRLVFLFTAFMVATGASLAMRAVADRPDEDSHIRDGKAPMRPVRPRKVALQTDLAPTPNAVVPENHEEPVPAAASVVGDAAPQEPAMPTDPVVVALRRGLIERHDDMLLATLEDMRLAWEQALSACSQLRRAEVDGWRLPTLAEVERLQAMHALPAVKLWTGTLADGNRVHTFDARTGRAGEQAVHRSAAAAVCVRKR